MEREGKKTKTMHERKARLLLGDHTVQYRAFKYDTACYYIPKERRRIIWPPIRHSWAGLIPPPALPKRDTPF